MEVKIAQLKARLSAYLDAVRRGETVTILDRKTPIARIVSLGDREDGFQMQAAEAAPREIGKVKGVRLKRPADVIAILREIRGER
ncbi:MAG: type II toxin-antitoxin system prevent-host-death family antitoxin [Planctomycetes bacterium]|nr:type II toxin-antitoxin system prevent-host-death family antitoxin [Planctomycetota bacterium]